MWLKLAVPAIVIIILALVFFDIGLISSRFIKPHIPFINSQLQSKSAIVSGTIQINGPIPQGSSISIGVKEFGSNSDFNIFVSGLPVSDDMKWQYTQAEEGKNYQFQAYIDLNGNRNTISDTLTVTAPATEEVLNLNIETPVAAIPQTATISGTLYINGYIPKDATFDILGRKYGSTGDFSEVVDNLPATVKRTISYSNAISGSKYEIKGQLFDKNGTVVGGSNPVVISAPSDNIQMEINSTAKPPQGAVTVLQNNTTSTSPSGTSQPTSQGGGSTISGIINFNGSAPSGSSIVILQRPTGTQNQFQVVVNGISPTNGSTWSWSGGNPGTSYDMIAVLKGQTNNQNTDYADSQTYTVAAPAQNQIFTLNTGISLGAPTGSVYTTCTTHNSNNTWAATINFTSVSGAQYYSLQVGSTTGGNDIINVNQAGQSNPAQTVNATLTDSVVYYAQYAVASVTNPTPAQYSPYSGTYTIKCP